MEKRRLGRTGHMSTVVTFGAIAIGKKEDNQEAADRAVELVLSHGVNHIDIAPGYGVAMERLAPWMPEIRQRVFLGAKTGKRTRDEAWENIEECMERLGVDGFDLFQHHSIGTMEELDKITAPGGALDALIELREQGGTRWLGITGHGPDAPAVHLEALRRFDFDTVMFPVSTAIFRNAEYRRSAEALFVEAHRKDVGVQAIKMLARGGWGDHEREYPVWYDPHRDQAEIDRALWWQLSQPIHTAPSTGSLALLPKILDAAERFRPLAESEQQEAVDSQSPPYPEPGLGILPAT